MGVDDQVVVNTLVVVAWIAWAQLALALVIETVTVIRGRRVTATPAPDQAAPVFAERDGEGGMRLPATFEILPGALTLRI